VGHVTLTGPPGTGKTRLSLQVAADVLDQFEDGACFVELAPISDPALVSSTIAQTLGVHDIVGRPPLDTLLDTLRNRQLLLVLDNFEQILPAAADVDTLLRACPRLSVLVTSRAALQLRSEHEYPVPPLALPDSEQPITPDALSQYGAVALFVERATAIKPDFAVTNANAPAVAEICARLDGLPLAIELAAARIRLLPPEAMLPRLGHGLTLLTGGRRDLPARQQALRSAISWSYDLLPEAEQRLFRCLGVFVGGFTLEGAEAVCGGSEPAVDPSASSGQAVLDGIDALVGNSLLRAGELVSGETRFGMLETIREYALERLRAAGEEPTLRRRHLRWFTDLAECGQAGLHGRDAAAWMDRLVADHDNVRSALAWSLNDPVAASRRLGLSLAGAHHQFWHFQSHLPEGRRWLEQTLEADRALSPTDGAESVAPTPRIGAFGRHPRVIALNDLSTMCSILGDWERGRLAGEDALRTARAVGDEHGAAHALVSLGINSRNMGRYDEAVTLFEKGSVVFQRLNDPFGLWRAPASLGNMLVQRGSDEQQTRSVLEAAIAAGRSLGHPGGVATSLRNLGQLALSQGELDRATDMLQQSLTEWAAVRSLRGRGSSLADLGLVCLARGDAQQAAIYFGESVQLCCQPEDQRDLARSLEGVAAAVVSMADLMLAPDLVSAARLLGSAAMVRDATGSPTIAIDRTIVERAVAGARASLDEHAFAGAWAEGRDLPLDEAVGIALELGYQLQATGSVPAV